MIFIRNPNLAYSRRDDAIGMRSEVSGHFSLSVMKADADGKPIEASRRVLAEFDNLILDQGLERMATAGDYLAACQVGSGTAAPVVGNTGLQARIAGTTAAGAAGSVAGTQPDTPFFGWATRTYQFPVGTAAGNLSEVGIGWSTTGTTLFARALIVNTGGVPITITILSDEILEVSYTIRNYPSEADAVQVVEISGTNYTVTRRPSRVTNAAHWALGGPASSSISSAPQAGVFGATAYSGGIGIITGLPSGTTAASAAPTRSAYIGGSRQIVGEAMWPIASANFGAGGIQSVLMQAGFRAGSDREFGAYQFGFSPALPKINTQVLTLNNVHSWARRVL